MNTTKNITKDQYTTVPYDLSGGTAAAAAITQNEAVVKAYVPHATTMMAVEAIPLSPKMSKTMNTSNPPGNCPDGGQWGKLRTIGRKTGLMVCLGCLAAGPFGLFLLACPQDEKDVYLHGRKFYDASGVYLFTEGNRFCEFIPSREAPRR